ncbi:beta-galactosidase GalB [Chitinophagaceae bacterium LWZ2-11]
MKKYYFLLLLALNAGLLHAQQSDRAIVNFNKGWKFYYADTTDLSVEYKDASYNDSKWRVLNLPHDYSIELPFTKDAPAKVDGAALPGGIGWYRKTFAVPAADKDKNVYIDFDGVYRLAEVWVNDHYLGIRPNGYISFRYDITPYLKFGSDKNIISVKVDNSKQQNSRWYSGSGIYRNVKLVTTNKIAVKHWGTYITTPNITNDAATVSITTKIGNATGIKQNASVITTIINEEGKEVATQARNISIADTVATAQQTLQVPSPQLWSIEHPYLYTVISKVSVSGKQVDVYETKLGIRSFKFDADKGFSLNGKYLKILGVCNHHDLGCFGAAFNVRAAERQLEILKEMGCNAIRTSHNPPAPELLDLCDKMGFLVMDEAFDMWKNQKTKYDYHLYWDEWHKKDLEDQVLRDRNHPSVIMWSIGNEINEQHKPNGGDIALELAGIVKSLDNTRPIVDANNGPDTSNTIIKSGAVDLIGYNYHHLDWPSFHDRYPGKIFLGSETTSALETRGYYQMPSDSLYYWPNERVNGKRVDAKMNEDHTVSAYDQVRAPWASTHEESWKPIKKYEFLSGMFIWTGFDYLGEPTPYKWPSRSSYFGIVDLAGFPKDVYYMYQSEWTTKDVLHIFPHWNWNVGDSVDVWAYYNHADEIELFLNDKSLGIKRKKNDDLHVMWRVKYEPGTIKAISRNNGKVVLTKEINTAGKAEKIELIADRKQIKATGEDVSFVTVRILDKAGNVVPNADNDIKFTINGKAYIAGVDNGDPTSMESFKADHRKAFHGLALVVIGAKEDASKIEVTATGTGLQSGTVTINAN